MDSSKNNKYRLTPIFEGLNDNDWRASTHQCIIEVVAADEDDARSMQQTQESSCIVRFIPHARTLRKAREQVKMMVADGVSLCQIKNYLSRWLNWWLKTATIWNYDELASQYIESCWEPRAAQIATFAFQQETIESHTGVHHECVTEFARAA